MSTVKLAGGNYGIRTTNRIPIPIEMLASGGTPPTPVTVPPFRGYAYTIDDDSYIGVGVPDDWEVAADQTGTVMTVNIKWACNENYAEANGEVQWRAAYETVDNGGVQAVGDGTTANLDSGDINIPTTARHVQQTTIGTIPLADIAVGDLLWVTISRIALTGGVDPTAEPEIYEAWIGYTRFMSFNR